MRVQLPSQPARPAVRSVRRSAVVGAVALAVLALTPGGPARADWWDEEETGSVSGRVLDPAGRAAAGVEVRVFELGNDGSDWWDAVEGTWTATDGTWSLEVGEWDVEPGRYHLQVSDPQQRYANTWYVRSRTAAQAMPVSFLAGTDRTGVDVRLLPHPSPVMPGKPSRLRTPRATRSFAGVPVDGFEGYQGQASCRNGARKGTRALLALIQATYGSQESAGLNRTCVKGSTSEHYDGRAIDWMVDSRTPAQAAKGDSFTRWLTRTRSGELGVMARRLGVMYVIWRGRIWKQYQASAGWQTYERCDRTKFRKAKWDSFCHRNHVHVSLTWNGARMKTSWWTGRPVL